MVEPSSKTLLTQQFAELLSLAVHEFRTPASVVGGYLRMLQRDTEAPLTDRQRKMVDEAEKSFARIVALVNELSDIGKLDDGRVTLQLRPLDLFELIAEVAATTLEAADREVRLETRGIETGAPIAGDANRLRDAFSAFFRAVLREQPSAGVVVVDCRQDAKAQTVTIVIAREPDVATATKTLSADFDDKRGGLGLALPIARRVVERHGGQVLSPASPDGTPSARSGIIVRLPLAAPLVSGASE